MKHLSSPLISTLKMAIAVLLCVLSVFSLFSCGQDSDYSEHADYAYLFSSDDDEKTKELKNAMISQIVSYNKGDASGYYAPFEMEKEDLDFNIAEYKALWSKYTLSYHIEEMQCAFLDDTNAQVLLTLRARAINRNDGAELYDYVMKTTYTMEKRGKTWKIITQSDSQIIE